MEEILTNSPKQSFGIKFRVTRRRIIFSAVLVLAALLFFIFNSHLFFGGPEEEEPSFQLIDTLCYALLLASSCLLCFLEVKLPYYVRAMIGWVMLPVLPVLAFVAVDSINDTRIASFSFSTSLANYIGYLMVFSLIFALCRRVWVTAAAGGGIFLFFGIVNYFTAEFRGAPILPWDIQTVSTAFSVAGGYRYEMTKPIAVSLLLYILICLLCFQVCPRGKEHTSLRFRMVQRAGAFAISAVLFLMIFPANILSDLGISVWAWNQKTSSKLTGVTAGFFANIQYLMVDKPSGYSSQKVKKLQEDIEALPELEALGSPSKAPTVIAVMNESMTDFAAVDPELALEPDNQPFLHSLQDSGKLIWGTACSSVYGGNTCNSEYEFLTGNTLSFLPTGSKPYQQYVDDYQTSLVSTLKSQGYRCIAIHPGQRTAWHRNTAYPFFRFDEFLDVTSFDVKRTLEHNLTSDMSCYDQVIYEYENRGNDPLFLFNVTIQNHGGYEDEDFPTTIRVKDAPGEFPEAEQYLSLVKKSDEALEKLITYFSEQPDPVVILFFGDHWPNLETGFISKLLGKDAESLALEDIMREHEVPFFLWANYPLKAEKIEKISLNYLSGLLLRAAGLKDTDYVKFLEYVRETFPVITANGMIDKDGVLYETGEKTPYSSILNDYAILQYNNAFGKIEKREEIFLP